MIKTSKLTFSRTSQLPAARAAIRHTSALHPGIQRFHPGIYNFGSLLGLTIKAQERIIYMLRVPGLHRASSTAPVRRDEANQAPDAEGGVPAG